MTNPGKDAGKRVHRRQIPPSGAPRRQLRRLERPRKRQSDSKRQPDRTRQPPPPKRPRKRPRGRNRQARPRKNNRRHAPEPRATRRIRRHAPKKPGHAARPAPTRRRKSRKPGSNAPGNGRCPTMKTNKWRHKNAIHTRTIGKTALNHYFCDHSGNRRGGVEQSPHGSRPVPSRNSNSI